MNDRVQHSFLTSALQTLQDPLPLSIIGTVGPSTGLDLQRWGREQNGNYTQDDVTRLASVIDAGHLAAVRINGAHVRPPEMLPLVIRFVRAGIQASQRKNVHVLLDLGGPKIRTRNTKSIQLPPSDNQTGENDKCECTIVLQTKPPYMETTEDRIVVPVSYEGLADDVQPESWIKIDDGQVTLLVERIDRREGQIFCRLLRGDRIDPDRGLNLIGSSISAPVITSDLDYPQLESLVSEMEPEEWPDFISLSFVKSAEDVRTFKTIFTRLVDRYGKKPSFVPGVIPKIERFELFDCLEDAISICDHTGADPLTFIKDPEVDAILGEPFPYSLPPVQHHSFRYDRVYHDIERNNLMPPVSHLRKQGMNPGRVIRGLYAMREILRIMSEVDAVMYARGDLSVEIDPRRTAVLRDFFQMCARRSGVADIIATDILPSLRKGTRITAAEGEALANLGRVRPSAIMASNEIAVGRDPIFVVREIYESVVYLLTKLFGHDPVQTLTQSYSHRNTALHPDAYDSPIHEGVQSLIKMLTRQEAFLHRGIEDRAGMIEEAKGKIFVIVGHDGRESLFTKTAGERLVKTVAAQRPSIPIIPICTGRDRPIPAFLDWGVRPPVVSQAFDEENIVQPRRLLKCLVSQGSCQAGEQCGLIWLNEQGNLQMFCGRAPVD